MDTIEILGSAMGLGLLAGIRLYATAFFLGLAIRIGWFDLTPVFSQLSVLAETPVLFMSGFAFFVEFLADKIPWIDSLWDSIHTFIRPIGAAALGATALGNFDPVTKTALALLCGGVAFTGHTSKAAARLAVNHSPEPVSNWILSFGEDLFIPVGLWLAFEHPEIAIAIASIVIGVFLWLSPKLLRGLNVSWVALKSFFSRWFSRGRSVFGPAVPPDSLLPRNAVRYFSAVPFQPLPEKAARKLRSNLNAGGIRAGIHCAATRSIRGLNNSTGYLCILPDQIVFVARRMFRMRLFKIPMEKITGIETSSSFFVDRLFLKTEDQEYAFDIFKAPRPRPVSGDLARSVPG